MDILGLLEGHMLFIIILFNLVKLKISHELVVWPLLLLCFALIGHSIG